MFVAGLVHYDKAASWGVIARMEAAEKEIESVADVLKRESDRVVVSDRPFVDNDSECSHAFVSYGENMKGVLNDS